VDYWNPARREPCHLSLQEAWLPLSITENVYSTENTYSKIYYILRKNGVECEPQLVTPEMLSSHPKI
jgi:hypothetical protein